MDGVFIKLHQMDIILNYLITYQNTQNMKVKYIIIQMSCQNNHQDILMINVKFLMNDTYKYMKNTQVAVRIKFPGIKSAKWKM